MVEGEGEGERAVKIFGRESFDAVLCHGALMYLEDSRPMSQNLTAIARPGALISVLAKNASALAMRPALKGRYGEALDALDADRDLGRLEAVTRGEEARERFGGLQVLDGSYTHSGERVVYSRALRFLEKGSSVFHLS